MMKNFRYFPLKEEEEKNHDENTEDDIPREHEPIKIAAGDLRGEKIIIKNIKLIHHSKKRQTIWAFSNFNYFQKRSVILESALNLNFSLKISFFSPAMYILMFLIL